MEVGCFFSNSCSSTLLTLEAEWSVPSFTGMERFFWTDGDLCLRVFVQMQKGQLPKRSPPDLPHFHLHQRGSVGDPALSPLSCQSHAGSPAQRNHPGGWQQRWRSVEMFLYQEPAVWLLIVLIIPVSVICKENTVCASRGRRGDFNTTGMGNKAPSMPFGFKHGQHQSESECFIYPWGNWGLWRLLNFR